jgi:radical SAM superfamily enzyme YgiQ (UPF0313 family)
VKLTLIQPCIGREAGRRDLRSWQMEPLSLATLAGLTPRDVDVRLIDDRLEEIPFEESTDLVALTVETYNAQRAYQIASDYRRRGVPVVMGGFHATLRPDEVADFAESVVVGQAETIWTRVIDDYRHGTPEKLYNATRPVSLGGAAPDRSIFAGKRYLPIGLVEGGRGCAFRCDFCAVGAYHRGCLTWRPVDEIVGEMVEVARERRLIFLVDDNIAADLARAKELFRELAPHRVKWVSQCSVHAALDEEFLDLMVKSGCQGVLVGFESLSPATLQAMNKSFNTTVLDRERPLRNLARHRVPLFGTFIFGYDEDNAESFDDAVAFAREQRMALAAFNHVVPFPGTPLYERLETEDRLLYPRWWLEPHYRFNDIAFRPASMTPFELKERCIRARRAFYSTGSIVQRVLGRANRSRALMLRNYLPLNILHRLDVDRRNGYPLGDKGWTGTYLPARSATTDVEWIRREASSSS